MTFHILQKDKLSQYETRAVKPLNPLGKIKQNKNKEAASFCALIHFLQSAGLPQIKGELLEAIASPRLIMYCPVGVHRYISWLSDIVTDQRSDAISFIWLL